MRNLSRMAKRGEVTGMSCLIRVVWREKKEKSLSARRLREERPAGSEEQSGWYGYVRDRPVREVHQADYTLVGTTYCTGCSGWSVFFEQRLQSRTYLLRYSSCSLPFLVRKKNSASARASSSRRSSSHLFHNSLFRRRIANLTTTFANSRILIFFKSVHSIFNLRPQIYTIKTRFMYLIPTTLTIPP